MPENPLRNPMQHPLRFHCGRGASGRARRRVQELLLAIGLLLALGACRPQPPDVPPSVQDRGKTTADSGAISSPEPHAEPTPKDVLGGTKWPAATLTSGVGTIHCDIDYASDGAGHPLGNLDYFSVLDAMDACRERGVVRLHYRGKIAADFADLVERVAAMAKRMDIDTRILDIDSAGGQVEDGIRAGDAIGASQWTIWVREGAVCHSACVLILAAGDNRLISGDVGIHRMIRMRSNATTRDELNQELHAVHAQLKTYLERNGAAVAIADLMMTVPSRDLRLLTQAELQAYGLDGANAAQEDLERIRLLRRCGEDFLRRKEAFAHEFGARCGRPGAHVDEMNRCGLALRERYGFPDRKCPDDSPMAEQDAPPG